MSILLENVAAEIAAETHPPPAVKQRPGGGKKVYKPQLATKVKWALEDAMQRTCAAQRRMRRLFEDFEEMRQAARKGCDVQVQMGRMEHELFGLALDVAEMERIIDRAVRESRPIESKSTK